MLRKLVSLLAAPKRGEVNIGGVLMLGIAMIFIAVGFIMFPIATNATDNILNYQYSGNASITDATYTGLTAITGITPLLILLGFLAAGVISGMMGVSVIKGGSTASANPGSLIMLGVSIVFIALGLIMFPVALDGISSVISNGGQGLNAAYTGLASILYVAPMLILLAYLSASVISGFFGLKQMRG